MVRRELLERLTSAGRVLSVVAPAGAGKTVLVRSWIAERGLEERVAWVTVVHPERDAQHFWLAVFDGLAGVLADGEDSPPLTPAPDLDVATIVGRVVDQVSGLSAPAWLVLDDLQELTGPAVEQLERLLSDASPWLRFVFITRRDLRLGLHRVRLAGELTEIRQADLRFGLDDARALFRAAGLDPSETTLQQLLEHTEGWAAGLRLAALSLIGAPDPERLAQDFSGTERTVAEYLLAEVLEHQPAEVARLLLRTSILDRVTGPLADRLTGGGSGQRILDELEQSGAFVVALDPERIWFRYHRLFAEMLALELRRTAPEALIGLHEAGAAWLDEHGFAVEAIRQAQAAESWPLAARILADHWHDLYFDGRAATARELLAAFPPGMTEADPQLSTVATADAIARGAMAEAEQHLARAGDRLIAVPEDRRRRLEIALASMRLTLSRSRNDLQAVVEEAERLLAHGEAAVSTDPRLTGTVRALALSNLGSAELWTGRFTAAEVHLGQALASAREVNRPMLELIALTHLALLRALEQPSQAEAPALAAIELAHRHGWAEEPFAAMAHCVLALSRLGRGRLADADSRLAAARRSLRGDGQPAVSVMLLSAEGALELARDRPGEALERFERAAAVSDALVTTHFSVARVEALRVLTLIRLGRAHLVAPASGAPGPAAADLPWIGLAEAARRLQDGDPVSAGSVAESVSAGADVDPLATVLALLLQAQAADAGGDAGATSRALERSLDIAEPTGLLLPFLIFPSPALLERHRRLGSAHASLIAEILALLAGRTPLVDRSEMPPLTEPRSASERRVLRYLATNLPAPEIAAELFVSVNTVRTHMRHVYAKLGVHRRAAAVEQARRRGLLAPASRPR